MTTTLLVPSAFLLFILAAPRPTSGALEVYVLPNPSLIYHSAPKDTSVLRVEAYDSDSLKEASDVTLPSGEDPDYFTLTQQPQPPSEWSLKVRKPIDKPVGYVFHFRVYATDPSDGSQVDRPIIINVTTKNIFPPKFEKPRYSFVVLRNGVDKNLTHVGTLNAVDRDREPYNSEFHYHILGSKKVSDYFDVDLVTGDIELLQNLEPDVKEVHFNVTTLDSGSPQLLDSTMVVINVTDVAPPDIFCVAVEKSVARICWKDPTNGSYVMKYELLFQMDGQNATKIPVRVNGIRDETCSIVSGSQLGRNYTFTVRVLNGLEWSPESLQRKVKIERRGLYGDCPLFSNCSVWEPCKHGGQCLVNDDNSYSCNCTEGWGGRNCTGRNKCGKHNPCNGGTCLYAGDGAVNCSCPTMKYGERCQHVSPCIRDLPCGDGTCIPDGEEKYVCHCVDGTMRYNCINAYCEEDGSFYDKTGRYVWKKTLSGDTAFVACHYGPNVAFRRCSVDSSGKTFWRQPDTSKCQELSADDVSKNLRLLASSTRDASVLKPEEIANITKILEEYFVFSFDDIHIARDLTMVVGNLMDANETVLVESNSRSHSSERLVWLLEEYVSKVNTSVTIATENINLQVVNHTNSVSGYEYQPELQVGEQNGVSLSLPPETLTATPEVKFPRIQLMTFRSSSFFIPKENPPEQEVVLKQWVVTAVVHGKKLTNLSTPVEIVIQNIEKGGNHTCVFWDVQNRTWSQEGVVTATRNHNHTICLSYHLTSFAILLDPSPDSGVPPEHERILTYISYIGCGISVVGLALTIITYSLFRCLNREKSGKILLNLCSSMLLLNVVFIVGSETSLSVSGDAMCKAVAVLLHYFLLASLTWMMVEAVNMYHALITVFTKYSRAFMLKRCLFAWGIPAVIVIITVVVNVDNYKTNTDLCFLSQGNRIAFYVGLLGPASLILLVNVIIFIMVSRVILRPKFKGQVGGSDNLNPAQIRGAFTVMTLLGVTWVFGPFAISEAKLVVNYVFAILNSLQGFLIFVFRCCFNPEVRMAWVMLIKTGKLKRRRGPVKGYTSDTNSSKGDSKLNVTVADTMKSNMYNSFGKPRNVITNDKNIDTKTNTPSSKASKDLHCYFEDLQRFEDGSKSGRRPSNTSLNGRRLSTGNGRIRVGETNGHNYTDYCRNGNQNGVTTIYQGRYNESRRTSWPSNDTDELTRL